MDFNRGVSAAKIPSRKSRDRNHGRFGQPQATEPAGIDAALTRIVEMESPANSAIWRSMTSVPKTGIVAPIENDGRKLQSRQVAATRVIAPSTMRDTLGALEQRQVIRQDLDDPQLHYLLVAPFFRAWLRREQHAWGIQSD